MVRAGAGGKAPAGDGGHEGGMEVRVETPKEWMEWSRESPQAALDGEPVEGNQAENNKGAAAVGIRFTVSGIDQWSQYLSTHRIAKD